MRVLKNMLHRWLTSDRLIGQRLVAALAGVVHDRGNRDPGWYGTEQVPAITGSWRHIRFKPIRQTVAALSRQLDFYGDQIFFKQVWQPIAGLAGKKLEPLRNPEDLDLRLGDEYLASRQPVAKPSASPPSFSIITPYYRHFSHFADCARSVATAMRRAGPLKVEWIVVNDDPSITNEKLWALVPTAIQDRTRMIANSSNMGNTATLNAGIRASQLDWIVFLDCDDMIANRALRILGKYVSVFPRCRYFSSSMLDIDESGRVLRYRIRDSRSTQLFTEGMTAGHLKAVRRDAFDDLGLLDARFDGCQDYEFALRTAMGEPVCFIPEFLYRYRSHSHTQTLSGLNRQLTRARDVRRMYTDRIKEVRFASDSLVGGCDRRSDH